MVKSGSGQLRFLQDRVRKVGSREIPFGHVGIPKIRAPECGATKIGSCKLCCSQVRTVEISEGEVTSL